MSVSQRSCHIKEYHRDTMHKFRIRLEMVYRNQSMKNCHRVQGSPGSALWRRLHSRGTTYAPSATILQPPGYRVASMMLCGKRIAPEMAVAQALGPSSSDIRAALAILKATSILTRSTYLMVGKSRRNQGLISSRENSRGREVAAIEFREEGRFPRVQPRSGIRVGCAIIDLQISR